MDTLLYMQPENRHICRGTMDILISDAAVSSPYVFERTVMRFSARSPGNEPLFGWTSQPFPGSRSHNRIIHQLFCTAVLHDCSPNRYFTEQSTIFQNDCSQNRHFRKRNTTFLHDLFQAGMFFTQSGTVISIVEHILKELQCILGTWLPT